MSEKFRPDRKIGFQNMFYTKCINVTIILRSIYSCILATSRYNICHLLHVSFANSLTLLRCSLDLDQVKQESALIWIQKVWQ